MYLPILRVHFTKRSANGLSNDTYWMLLFLFSSVFFFFFFFMNAYVVGTHLNRIEESMLFKWVPKTYPFTKKTKIAMALI